MKEDKRTDQEKEPHASLVEVRNTIEVVTGVPRREAAAIANQLTSTQCDAVVKADGDPEKVKQAIQIAVAKKVAKEKEAEAAKAEPKKKSK